MAVRRCLSYGGWPIHCQNKAQHFVLSCERYVYHANGKFDSNGRFTNCLNYSRCQRYSTRAVNVTTPVFLRAEKFVENTALITQHGKYSYSDLLLYSANFAQKLNTLSNKAFNKVKGHVKEFPLEGERIAFLCENDMSYKVAQWATWMCKAIAVPLCKSHPISELEYFVQDSGACFIVGTEDFKSKLEPIASSLNLPLVLMPEDAYTNSSAVIGDDDDAWMNSEVRKHLRDGLNADEYKKKRAMIIYTSGTTGKPKGVVTTFGNIDAQMQGMIKAWGWRADDSILHVLPLHHVHGVVNVLMTPLYCGAQCVMLPQFNPKLVWESLISDEPRVNVFMAVPTVYSKLIQEYDKQIASSTPYLPAEPGQVLKEKFRLMVSGSAALPQPVMERWAELSGHTLLERYGMTEIGMALTNPLHGHRVPGAVGMPFPGVSARVVEWTESGDNTTLVTATSNNVTVTPGKEGVSGELLIKGDNVFQEYWNKPEATAESFTPDGWFKTGDTALYSDGVFRIVGRTSVDVIKSGGYKISALDIERHLLAHPDILDVAVIGLPDETWGQLVTAVMVTRSGDPMTLDDLRGWAQEKMAPYHVPRLVTCLQEMPRNAMGKVNKKQLAKDLFPEKL
ncbi:malonate--CoA ligase ACSF3, mitochondrial-like isoform X2 [Mya arenaria]|nr:malonate--CoA ligase ACSF3, mitochondrial-like isoform X2 [Mya arenaria]XP_052816605.1 malonate--CoA ligase ACSF3, mitochondrial-like isoform X2 [Mya arenaria]XP_052816607.1 malonate--CoA ligase ACSF3, mitochondrial-like isoform X2 [Mya arenaria]XP_052816608.1 malonate--CoA ligase ACSF3, mitochondrial-like isoform X2 [Mya arenaria]XP_052816609.1 malonate--CoA ligase ACSF3, mitochondrial-like isoform X2 [Mya arenaria]